MRSIEISSAITSHLTWKTKVRSFLKTKDPSGVCTDHHNCQLGKWLDAGGKDFFEDPSVYRKLYKLHQEVHELCKSLVLATEINDKMVDMWDHKSEELLKLLDDIKNMD